MHLYTYDIFCEKFGFKIGWGTFGWYPFFYAIGAWPIVGAAADSDIDAAAAAAIGCLFACGWLLTRGANVQKYVHKTRYVSGERRPEAEPYFGPLCMATVPGTNLLCAGFWGMARHVNYFGEILQAVALALPGALVAADWRAACVAWAYPLYYLALFVPRQMDDDEQVAPMFTPHPLPSATSPVLHGGPCQPGCCWCHMSGACQSSPQLERLLVSHARRFW